MKELYSGSFSDIFNSIEPGDDATAYVVIHNASASSADFYLRNEAIKTLEESYRASGGLYTYRLTYSGTATPLYDSESVGGDKTQQSVSAVEGLHQIDDKLEDYFFLTTLAPGASGTVELYVKLEGETQGNIYQSSAARLRLQFAARSDSVGERVIYGPKTGDDSRSILWAGVFVLCFAVCMFALLSKHRRKSTAALILVSVLICAPAFEPAASAAPQTDYQITVYAGNKGAFADGSKVLKLHRSYNQEVNLSYLHNEG